MFAKRYRKVLKRERLRRGLASFFMQHGRFQFGAGWHLFDHGKRLPPSQVSKFETNWNVSLPPDYKATILDVGDGCAGPYFGLSPLEEWCQPYEPTEFAADFLSTSFDPQRKNDLGLRPGAMRICNAGCEHYYLLVVSGSHNGEIWHDAEVDGLGVLQLHGADGHALRFVEWINGWLNATERRDAGWIDTVDGFWLSHEFAGHAVAQTFSSAKEPLETVAANQLPCPACVKLLVSQRPVPRMIVTSSKRTGLSSPKRAAMLAANGRIKVIPRKVFP